MKPNNIIDLKKISKFRKQYLFLSLGCLIFGVILILFDDLIGVAYLTMGTLCVIEARYWDLKSYLIEMGK